MKSGAPWKRTRPQVLVASAAAALVWATACGTAKTPTAAADATANSDGSAADAATGAAGSGDTGSGDGVAALPCATTPVNALGIGKPCGKPEDCFGQPAVTCADLGGGAPRFCAQYCFGLPGECGVGALCVPRGKEQALCMPLGCAAQYAVAAPSDVTCTQPCSAGSVNSFGVGKPCKTNAECAEQAAKTCPITLRPDNPDWCSMLCSDDADCGPSATCWRRETVEQGVKFVIGSCAPTACCKKK